MGIGNVIKKVATTTTKGVAKGAVTGAQYGFGASVYAADKTLTGLGKVGKFAGKGVVKKVEPGFDNAYTGYKMKSAPHLLVAGAGVAYAAGAYAFGSGETKTFENISTRAQKIGEVSYGGQPDVMDADGVGSKTQAPTLGASGDLVFGLHNNRRG